MQCQKCSKMFTPIAKTKITQICNECSGEISQNNVDAKDIYISKGQSKILKDIVNLIPKNDKLSRSTLKKALQYESEIKYAIKDNWGTQDHFIDLVFAQIPNSISLILYFLHIKNKIGEIPTKPKMKRFSNSDLSEYELLFGSWEQFLDLLGFDPWYRDNNSPKQIVKQKHFQNETKVFHENLQDYFIENDSVEETIEKVKLLKNKIEGICEKKDSDENYSDYKYKEMFTLLQEYLKILPNDPKYNDVNYFL